MSFFLSDAFIVGLILGMSLGGAGLSIIYTNRRMDQSAEMEQLLYELDELTRVALAREAEDRLIIEAHESRARARDDLIEAYRSRLEAYRSRFVGSDSDDITYH
jgi:hypothetical protein